MVEVTTIREGREFEDHDYPDQSEVIEKLVDAKGTFILWTHKDIIVQTYSSSIVLPQSIEAGALLLQTCQSLLKALIFLFPPSSQSKLIMSDPPLEAGTQSNQQNGKLCLNLQSSAQDLATYCIFLAVTLLYVTSTITVIRRNCKSNNT